MTEEKKQQNQGQGNDQHQNQGNQQGQNNQGQDGGQGKGEGQEAKFTQEDLNAFAAKVRSEEKAKYEKLQTEAKRKAELDKMEENERLKAEKDDIAQKLQELETEVENNKKRTAAIEKLAEAKLDSRLIDVLMSDKSDEEKIKLMADVQKEIVDKAIKEAMPSHKPTGKGTATKSGFASETKVKYNFQKFK